MQQLNYLSSPVHCSKKQSDIFALGKKSNGASDLFLALKNSVLIGLFLLLLCTSPVYSQNAIVTENAKTGNPYSEWGITGIGDTTIQGFATAISVNKGETVSFKIKTDAAAYTINIYRIGYYKGNGARKVGTGTITATLPQIQPAGLYDATTGLLDCGNWGVSGQWNVPADAVSGVYIARLIRADNGGASHIIFIVRDDVSTSDLYFKTSDATWQAYNNYGGNDLYEGSTTYPVGRAPKISYNRPFYTNRPYHEMSFFFTAEFSMVRFLEHNGYDVTYATDIDADFRGSLIKKHKVFLSVGHDEYWSGQERNNVEAARNAGKHLAFFSGDESYWKTRWEPSVDGSATPYRTLVCYKDGTSGEYVCGYKCDPMPNVWTGLWRAGCDVPNTDACRPENAMSGNLGWYSMMTSITVPYKYKDFRFWRNTGVASLTSGQTATLCFGALGYEFDYEQNNGSYPPGRIGMSETAVASGIVHKVSLYRHSSGALVFAAGTINWAWGLDAGPDYEVRSGTQTDARMQQATVNVLADMGIQPRSLQSGLVAATMTTDRQPPFTYITSPYYGSTVATGKPVTIAGTSWKSPGVVAGVEVSVDNGKTWSPAVGTNNWTYTWTPATAGTYNIKVRAVDDMANLENTSTFFNSTTVFVKPSISINDVTAYESQGAAALIITLSSVSNEPINLVYSTKDGTATSKGRTPDYIGAYYNSVTIPAGSLTKTISLPITKNTVTEPAKYFYVQLDYADFTSYLNTIMSNNMAKVTILDGNPPANINNSTSANSRLFTDRNIENDLSIVKGLSIKTFPNPTTNYFTLIARSNSDRPVSLRVLDAAGRVVETFSNVASNKMLQFGHHYRPGIYLIEAIQGGERKTIKLIKEAE